VLFTKTLHLDTRFTRMLPWSSIFTLIPCKQNCLVVMMNIYFGEYYLQTCISTWHSTYPRLNINNSLPTYLLHLLTTLINMISDTVHAYSSISIWLRNHLLTNVPNYPNF
jgi:hypothetical protein